jgi:hypothetical protein
MPLLTFPNERTLDPAPVLTHCKNALADLLASNGYKTARAQNQNDTVFYTTYVGKCEKELRAAIKLLTP